MDKVINISVGVVLTALTFLFGDFTLPLQVLICLVAIDFLTGILAAGKESKIESGIAHQGIKKKIGYFVAIAVIYQADKLFGSEEALKTLAIWTLATAEFLSIVENLQKLGVPIPKAFTDKLSQLKSEQDQPQT